MEVFFSLSTGNVPFKHRVGISGYFLDPREAGLRVFIKKIKIGLTIQNKKMIMCQMRHLLFQYYEETVIRVYRTGTKMRRMPGCQWSHCYFSEIVQ